jgi:hypothetical protein
MAKIEKLERPLLALWMWERGLKPKDGEAPLRKSYETIRRYCLPYTDPNRQVPDPETMELIVRWTGGEVTPPTFYPPELNGERRSPIPSLEGAA